MFYYNLYGRSEAAPTSTDWLFFPMMDKKLFDVFVEQGWTFQRIPPKGCHMAEFRKGKYGNLKTHYVAAQS